MTFYYEGINGHTVGIVMKELVRRVITVIRNGRIAFEVNMKPDYAGNINADVFTSVDKKAQEVYLKSIQECFPDFGIIAEEDDLKILCKNNCGIYFTIDPLDGTKAFIREQSHGIGTMISLVNQNAVIAAFIGDINTQEIYGYRPDSNKVHRITDYNTFQILRNIPLRPHHQAYALLRDQSETYSKETQKIIKTFKNIIIDGGSIGIWLARLWKGEVGAAFVPAGYETPWDIMPIYGISQKLGYHFLTFENGKYEDFVPSIKDPYCREKDILIIHKEHL